MSDEVLHELATTGFGPVTLEDRGKGGYAASALGHEVTVTGDGPALRCRTTVEVAWPEVGQTASGYDPITNALQELAYYHRTDLVHIEGAPGSPLTISLWMPAADATAASVAAAVWATAHIAELAHRTVSDLSALLESEAKDRADEAWYEATGSADAGGAPPAPAPPPTE
jgi:hypothetical protein